MRGRHRACDGGCVVVLRINLLPPEILDRRKYEKWFPWVFLTGLIVLGVVIVVWLILIFMVNAKQGQLQQTQESVQSLKASADAYAVFEQRELTMKERAKVVDKALASRINIGEVANEVSLVLPSEVWIDNLAIGEGTVGMTMRGYTPSGPDQDPNEGFSSVAATMVRLNELPTVSDIWLQSAAKSQFSAFALTGSAVASAVPVVQFGVTGKVASPPAASVLDSYSPAPPSTSGK